MFTRTISRGIYGLSSQALEQKETARLGSSTDKRSADSAVQTEHAVGFDGLSEAIEGSSVSEGKVIGLGLQPDLDGVERVFYIFAHDTSSLIGVSELC